MTTTILRISTVALVLAGFAAAQDHKLGYDTTPYYPGSKWRVHDSSRPRPGAVTPSTCNGSSSKTPSDAEVLFDGHDLSKWVSLKNGVAGEPGWKLVEGKPGDGIMEVIPGKGDIYTKASFGDMQLHVEWASPTEVKGDSQNRGNSGIKISGLYEIQVLDSFDNLTYADGQAGAIYGQYPPLVNASCKPGEWQAYDIIFEAPKFQGTTVIKPAYATVIHNGIVVQNHEQILGTTKNANVGVYEPHPDKPIMLQNHNTPVRYRLVWVRRLQARPE